MTWFKIDDGFADHPKVIELQTHSGWQGALAVWVLAGAWCSRHLTDGVITMDQVTRLGGTKHSTELLVRAGLWVCPNENEPAGMKVLTSATIQNGTPVSTKPNRHSFRFHDWSKRNLTRNEIEAAREKNREKSKRTRGTTQGTTQGTNQVLVELRTPLLYLSSPLLSLKEEKEEGNAPVGADPVAPKVRKQNPALGALKAAMSRHMECPPALSNGPALKAASRLKDVIAAGCAETLDDAATCLVLAAIASGRPFPWCLLDAEPERPRPQAARQRMRDCE